MSSLYLLIGLSLLPGAAAPPKMADPVPYAAGVCLVEVVRVTELIPSVSEGLVGVNVKLRIVRGSGAIREDLCITKAADDPLAPAPAGKPKSPLAPNSLKKGHRYWIAFASDEDTDKYPQGVIAFWPENDPKMAKLLRAATRTDHYKWHPQYDPKTGLTYGHLDEPAKRQWRLRVEKKRTILWEKVIPGTKSEGYFSWGLWDNGYCGFPTEMPRCGKFLLAETAQALAKDNEFALPAGTYLVATAYEPETGRRLAAWVSRHHAGRVDVVHRDYEAKTGKLRCDVRFDWPTKGGRAVGAAEEKWWRKVVRTFDPATGRLRSEEVFRYDPAREGERWVKTKPGKPTK